jgi:hypothetical protein
MPLKKHKEKETQISLNNTKNKIKNILTSVRMSEKNIKRVMETVDRLSDSEHMQNALNFLTEAVHKSSKREMHYLHSDYLAEYFCTLSNVGFFAVGLYYRDYITMFAGIFSLLKGY